MIRSWHVMTKNELTFFWHTVGEFTGIISPENVLQQPDMSIRGTT